MSRKRQRTGSPGAGAPSRPPGHKQHVALHCGYIGTAYQGLQWNPSAHTVEAALEAALGAAGCIAPANRGELRKVHWVRASRTDKGVHAVGQVVSLRLLVPAEHDSARSADRMALVERINAHLPPDVRVLDATKVTRSFHAKNSCAGRVYEYVLPLSMLPDANEAVASQLRRVMALYVGTRSYHNFTNGMASGDDRARRYVTRTDVTAPLAIGPTRHRCVVVTIQGQSFVLHQIRKMVGAALCVCAHVADESYVHAALNEPRVAVPLAPAAGLVLNAVLYEPYERRWGLSLRPEGTAAAAFRTRIQEHVVELERETGCFSGWWSKVAHTYLAKCGTADGDARAARVAAAVAEHPVLGRGVAAAAAAAELESGEP